MYRIIRNAGALLFCAPLFFLVNPSLADEPEDSFFDKQVAPLLVARCAECHHEEEPEAELNLLSEATARKGGENGPALVPGDLGKSLLWKRVAANEMPPEDPLDNKEKQILKKWIVSGASWGTDPVDRFLYTTDKRAGYDWWALQPLEQPKIPSPTGSHCW